MKNRMLVVSVLSLLLYACANNPKISVDEETGAVNTKPASTALSIMRAAGLDKKLRDINQEDIDKSLQDGKGPGRSVQVLHAVELVGYHNKFMAPPPGMSFGAAMGFSVLGLLTSDPKDYVPAEYPWVIYWVPTSEVPEDASGQFEYMLSRFEHEYRQVLPKGHRIDTEKTPGRTVFGDSWMKYEMYVRGGGHCQDDACKLGVSRTYFHKNSKPKSEWLVERAPEIMGGHDSYPWKFPLEVKSGLGETLVKVGGLYIQDIWVDMAKNLPEYAAIYISPKYNDGVPVVVWGGGVHHFIDPHSEHMSELKGKIQ